MAVISVVLSGTVWAALDLRLAIYY